ncbi:hypothetical protein C2S51_030246 [Perilla frutescens var. frutescens]|nr:hypothetical protein C2S51_030246 [Perilla frutescens var. frutescens]
MKRKTKVDTGQDEGSGVNEKIDALTSLVRGLAMAQTRPNCCGVCSENGHFTDECPNLHEHSTEQACYGSGDAQQDGFRGINYDAPRGDNFRRKRNNDPYSNTYNPG